MKITDIIQEADHPFNYAYAPQKNQHLFSLLYQWAEQWYGHTATPPSIMIVNHEHMQRAASRVPHKMDGYSVFGWFSQAYPDKVFVSDKVNITNKLNAAWMVHEFVHYLQNKFPPERTDMASLEQQADQAQDDFLKQKDPKQPA